MKNWKGEEEKQKSCKLYSLLGLYNLEERLQILQGFFFFRFRQKSTKLIEIQK